jgi:hypothetical protein
MEFKGEVPTRSKIVLGLDSTVLEEVNIFTYLGCKIS